MPIKHAFVLKTVVRGSETITTPASILKELKNLRVTTENDPTSQEGEFEILVTKKDGIISEDLYTEGKLTPNQSKIANTILSQAIAAVKAAAGDDEKLKIKFVVKK